MRHRHASFHAAVVIVLLALAGATRAHAAANDIRWGDCSPGGGLFDFSLTCTGSAGATIVVGIVPPPGLSHVVGFEAQITLTSPDVPYWEIWPGGCRNGAVTASFDFTGGPSTCVDPWQGQLAGSLQVVAPPYADWAPTLHLSASLPAGTDVAMDPQTEYYLAKIHISNLGYTSCPGCGGPGCFVLDSVCLLQSSGEPRVCQGYREVGTPWVLLNDPQHLFTHCALPVPTRSSTWGALKSIYR